MPITGPIQQAAFFSGLTGNLVINGVTAGDLLVIPFFSAANFSAIISSDSTGNVWADAFPPFAYSDGAATRTIGMKWCTAKGGNTTVAITGSGNTVVAGMSQWRSPVAGEPLIPDKGNDGVTSGTTTGNSGNITPSAAIALLIGMARSNASTSQTTNLGTGWTRLTALLNGYAPGYQILNSLGTFAYQPVFNVSGNNGAMIVSFILQTITQSFLHNVDADIQFTQSGVHNADCYIQLIQSGIHSVDCYVQGTSSLTHSVDCDVQTLRSLTHNADCDVQTSSSPSHNVDCDIQIVSSLSHGADCDITKELSFSHSVDCDIQATRDFLHGVDCYVQIQRSFTHSADCAVALPISFQHSVDCDILANSVATHSADCFVVKSVLPSTRTFQVRAVLEFEALV